LVNKQIASGLTVPQFCNRHNLNSKYFYSRKSKVVQSTDNSGFILTQIIAQQSIRLEAKLEQNIKLVTISGELSLPRDTSDQFIVELLNGLAS